MSSMIIVMKSDATQEDVDQVLARLSEIGSEAHVSVGQTHTVIGVIGNRDRVQQLPWEALSGVERAVPVLKPFKFVSRDFHEADTVIKVRGARIGGGSSAWWETRRSSAARRFTCCRTRDGTSSSFRSRSRPP